MYILLIFSSSTRFLIAGKPYIGHIPSARWLTGAVSTTDNIVIVIGGKNDKREHTNTVWIGSCEPQ